MSKGMKKGVPCLLKSFQQLSLGDDWLPAASLLFFEGFENGRFGQFTANDMLTIRLRYSF
jgi:hypothetical protein